MNKYFAYVRVSTTKQGHQGVSLPEQRDAIRRYAATRQLKITDWFEEMETAAKSGRSKFGQLVKRLRAREASGVIFHKIDRGTRNYSDLDAIHSLMDDGYEVHSAHDNMLLNARSARLTADIQTVVAVDYIRNLREETKKGYYGRLKQGIAPFPAPIGYLNRGRGQPKAIDPLRAPFVRLAFESYATGNVGLRALIEQLRQKGLEMPSGKPVSINVLNRLLSNTFYYGVIRIKTTGEEFTGTHEPIISKELFDRVQQVMKGKVPHREIRHTFLFSRMIQCRGCGRRLIGELQKGRAYYRCHNILCPGTCVSETAVEQIVIHNLENLEFSNADIKNLDEAHAHRRRQLVDGGAAFESSLNLRLAKVNKRLNQLTDAFLDSTWDTEVLQQRKTALLTERRELQARMAQVSQSDPDVAASELDKFVELAKNASLSYRNGYLADKREILFSVMSNLAAEQKTLTFTWNSTFSDIAKRASAPSGDPHRDNGRTFWLGILDRFLEEWRNTQTGLIAGSRCIAA